jgi:hypothetical protein
MPDLQGFDEFKRDTDKITKNLPDATKASSVDFASEWVSAAVAAASTPQEQLAAAELRSFSSGDGSQIECPSPLFYGAEFGGQGRPETMQFPPFQGQRGYWFYPARRANEDRFAQIWDKGIEQAMTPWDRTG